MRRRRVEQEETDWHSVDDGAHIDEGSLLLLLSPPAVLLLEREAPVSRLIFFERADLQSSSRSRAGHCRTGVIDVEIIIGERSRALAQQE